MALDHDISAMAADGARAKARIALVARQISGLTRRHADAQALFLDAKGEVKPEAARFFAWIAAQADVAGRSGPVSDEELREALGAQRIVRAILSSLELDAPRLQRLQQLLQQQKRNSE